MLQVGDVIAERYVVEQEIARGGMATVYRVRHTDLGTTHALKMLLRETGSLAERFLLEGQIQARIGHPNVVTVTDVLRHNGQIGLLMEYVPAKALLDMLEQRGALPMQEALRLMAPILDCVHAAHAAGILHRDLKPANILMRKTGDTVEPLVTDFGIARVRSAEFNAQKTADGVVMGSPGYMAPEQFLDPDDVDVRTDVFSLGTILYEMIAGEPAFKGKNGNLLLSSTTIEDVVPLRDVIEDCPASVCDAVMKALEKEPEDRHEDVAAFMNALYVDHRSMHPQWSKAPVTLAGEGPATGEVFAPTPRPRKRRWAVWAVVLVAAIALPVVLAVCVGGAFLSGMFRSSNVEEVTTAAVAPDAPAPDVLQTSKPDQPTATPEPAAATPEPAAAPKQTVAAPTPAKPVATAPATQEPEPGTDEPAPPIAAEPKPEPAPTVAVAPEEPAPTLPAWAEGSQTLNGLLYRQPFTVRFTPTLDRRFDASGTLTVGSGSRRLQFSGTYRLETSTLRLEETGGDLVIEGTLSASGFKGTYRRGRKKATALTLSR